LKLGSLFFSYKPQPGNTINIRLNSRWDVIFQLVLIRSDQSIEDIYRITLRSLSKGFYIPKTVTEIYIAITGGIDSLRTVLDLQLTECNQPISDLFITNWNTPSGKRYHSDPYEGHWNWLSPDIVVSPSTVSVIVHNAGNHPSGSFTLQFYSLTSFAPPKLLKSQLYQDGVPALSQIKIEVKDIEIPAVGNLAVIVDETGVSNLSLACTQLGMTGFRLPPVEVVHVTHLPSGVKEQERAHKGEKYKYAFS